MFSNEDMQSLIAQASQRTLNEVARNDAEEAVASYGEQGEFLRGPAVLKLQQLAKDGKLDVNNPHHVSKAFRTALAETAKEARQSFANDADPWNPYGHDSSVARAYFAERQAQIRRQKGLA
jgi:hypothetical protein